MAHTFTEDDEGKSVVNDQGEDVGIIADVEHGTAYVDPDPGLTNKIKSKLGWDDRDEDTYPLQEDAVESVTGNEVHLTSAGTAGTGAGVGTGSSTDDSGITDDDDGLLDDNDDTIGDDDDGLLDDDDTRR